MAWNPYRMPVNKFLIVNYWSPGVCVQPEGASIDRNFDERRGYGIDFAFLIFWGRKLAHFKTVLKIWDEPTWEEWQQFRPLLHAVPRRGAVNGANANGYDPATAMTIWHPQLVPLGITACVVEKEPQEVRLAKGVYDIPIEFCQVITKPRAAFAKPEAAKDTPLDPMDKLIAERRKQLEDMDNTQGMAPGAR
jgi:hypothetical protein